jgi:anti-sigma factor RsiW
MTNEDIHELVAAYALDALGADDRQAFESHLTGCERCRAELAGLSEAVGTLAFGVEGPAPPPALRGRILAAAREEPPMVVALRPRRTRAYAAAALAAAACAALTIGLYAGLSGGGSSNKRAMSLTVANGVAQLTVTGLPAAPAGKAYEIWVIEGEAVHPAGLFAGGGKTVVRLTRPVLVGSTVAVTLERAGGARAPTTPILLSTRLTA